MERFVVPNSFGFDQVFEWQGGKKTDPFSARLPHRNSLPFPEADRREAEEKENLSLSKVAKGALKLVKFEMPRLENGRSREGIWNLAK